MKLNKKQKLFVALLFLIVIFSGVYFLYRLNTRINLNVLLITVDSLRPDHLGCYGYKRDTSPHIDNLAKEGVIFTQAISQGSSTMPSLPSIMISLYPRQHRAMDITRKYTLTLPTLAEILGKNGYQTGAMLSNIILDTGVITGFNFTYFYPNASIVTKKAIDWIGKNKDKRFFLFIHYGDIHVPYKPPPPYNELFLPDKFKELGTEVLLKRYPRSNVYQLQSMPDLTEEDKDYYISQYDGGIRFTDDWIGILLKSLEKLRLEKRTLIILSADHGENLGDYNKTFFHGDSLYDVLLKVPLIIKGNIIPQGKLIQRQVQLIDIMPTILDALKIKAKSKMEGVSFLPLVLGKKQDGGLYAFSECRHNFCNMRSIRTEDWKLIFYAFLNPKEERYRWELFNLKNDPRESTNLIQLEQNKFESLKQKLRDWMKRTRSPSPGQTSSPLDEETKKRLKNLGYVQ